MVENRIAAIVNDIGHAIVACSGGVDSLLLATIFHRAAPGAVIVAHALGPAVPALATQRVIDCANSEGWQLKLIHSGEFADPVYRANPIDRCYYCKSHLYKALKSLVDSKVTSLTKGYTIVSGANMDDLGEYRPGLKAAEEFKVRHPFVEAGMTKHDIRELSRNLGLSFAELPASPCLASRLYTGTPVTVTRLTAVEHGEAFLKEQTGIRIVRCRIKQDEMHIEVSCEDQHKILPHLVTQLHEELCLISPSIRAVHLDPLPYQPGRAFVSSQ